MCSSWKNRYYGTFRHEPVDKHGHSHAAYSRDDGKQCVAERRKFSHKHLALDFQTYGEKEKRHQRVVDKRHDRHRCAMMAEKIEISYAKLDLVKPYRFIYLSCERQIDHQQCQRGRKYKHIAAAGIILYCLLCSIKYRSHFG